MNTAMETRNGSMWTGLVVLMFGIVLFCFLATGCESNNAVPEAQASSESAIQNQDATPAVPANEPSAEAMTQTATSGGVQEQDEVQAAAPDKEDVGAENVQAEAPVDEPTNEKTN